MEAKDRNVLAVDLGTSGPKVALISPKGEILDCVFEPNGLFLLPDGGAEQDPDDWWRAITTAARKVFERSGVSPASVMAVNCTAQWSGTVPVDRDGRHLMNAVIWMDSRGAPYVKKISDGLVKIEGYALTKALRWIRLTGGAPGRSGKDPTAHILFLKAERPEIYEKTYKFLEPKDYLNLRLTGQFAASFDSIALHWVTDNRDIGKVDYHPGLLRMCGLDRGKLPDLRPPAAVLGPLCKQAADDLGLSRDVQVIMGTPDLQSAAVGSGAVLDYQPHLYIGTSSWLTCHVPFKKTDLLHNMASLPSAIPNRYFIANEQESAGKCVQHLLDHMVYPDDEFALGKKPDDAYARLNRVAAKVPPGSEKLIFTPWLYGERTPVEDHRVRGGFFNQTLHTTREHCARAVLEGVAFNSRWLLPFVEKFIKRRLDVIRMIGGGAQSDVWCQIHADVLDRSIEQVADPIQANVAGAGFLALLALGELKVEDIPGLVKIKATYRPDPANRAVYDELFGAFQQIYKRNKGIYARLNRKA